MATAALTNTELRIIPLVEADLVAVEALFDEQCEEWLALFRWNYAGASRMIREVLRHRELSGFAVVRGAATIGFAFYVVEGNRCSIGDVYVSKPWRGIGADKRLMAAIFEELDRLARLRRIESQCLNTGNDDADEVFVSRGFERFERLYMMIDLDARGGSGPHADQHRHRSAGLTDITIRHWQDSDFAHAARVIHSSYRGEADSCINSQYRTEEGCAELLSIMTDHIWCGEFLPQVSQVAASRANGKKVGVLIASRISSGVGHIGQISVVPAYQSMGVGRRMILACLSEFNRLGFNSVSLAVTGANVKALRLYKSCGFRVMHEFPVYYRDKK